MYFIKDKLENKLIIDKSEFITCIQPIGSVSEIPDLLKAIKKKYPKATHYCTAYVFENSQGSNDDGEPSGTAGVPMLEVLNKHKLKHVLAVVVRYFGGIKLGAGGLIRAYAGSVAAALVDAPLFKFVTTTNFEVHFNYDQIGLVDHIFKDYITDKSFLGDVIYQLSFMDDLTTFLDNRHIFKLVKEKGTKDILVPWK